MFCVGHLLKFEGGTVGDLLELKLRALMYMIIYNGSRMGFRELPSFSYTTIDSHQKTYKILRSSAPHSKN